MENTEERTDKDLWWKILVIVVIILLLFLGGFWTGRKTMKTKTETIIEYVQLPPIHDTITQFKPKYIPADTASNIQTCVEKGLFAELFPWKTDTVFTKEDTTLIMGDWASRREYAETLFDINTVGKLDVSIGVQYNRLDTLAYTYTPVQKQTTTTIIKEPVFEPFIGGGLSVGIDRNKVATPGAAVQVGAFVKQNYGVSLEYQYMFGNIQNHEITALFLYKF
jgi:hypothetical protein